MTKFGKNLVILNRWRQKFCHIEPMTSKWHQKCSPLKVIEPLTEKAWDFWWAEKQRATWRNSFKNGKMFEWIIKSWMIEFGFCMISEGVIHQGQRPSKNFLTFYSHVSVDNLCTLQNFVTKLGFPLNIPKFESLLLSVSIIIKNISFAACTSG